MSKMKKATVTKTASKPGRAKNTKGKNNYTKKGTIVNDSIIIEIVSILCIAVSILILFSIFSDSSAGALGIWIDKILKGLFGFGAYVMPFVIIGISVYILFEGKKDFPAYKIMFCIGAFIVFISFVHLLNADQSVSYDSFLEYIKANFDAGSVKNGGFIGAVLGNFILSIFGSFSYIFLPMLFIIFAIVVTGKSFFKGISSSYANLKEKLEDIYYTEYEEYEFEDEDEAEIKQPRKRAGKTGSVDFVIEEEKRRKKDYKVLLPEDETTVSESMKAKFEKIEPIDTEINLTEFEIEPDIQLKGIINEEQEAIDAFFEKEVYIEPKYIEKDHSAEAMPKTAKAAEPEPEEIKIEILEPEEGAAEEEEREYHFPPIPLLQANTEKGKGNTKQIILENSKKLEDTLKSFGVEAKVIEVSKGPTVTRYELSPGPGVKVSKISGLADDLALNLAANGIRIEAPIPGKAAVGIEVPNKETQIVYFREVIEDENFQKFPSRLAFGLGKDIAGKTVVADIAKMPHLLIAGATGSGKSVCINTLVTSILYKANPDEVKLIMVDPKVVELSVYSGIPHLLIPVVTDPKKAAGALNWAVREMLRRYDLFAQNAVRDLKGYNAVAEEKGEFKPEPQIVIIIDELADLMMAAPGEVEDSICRLAQMARAAGLHLIIATQRPSVDVITGVIKANIPSRLAFAVSSGTDSRTILDMVGAEKLLGRGDMLFYPVGTSKPIRIQGAFISDKEVETIVEFLKQGNDHEFDQKMIEDITSTSKTLEIDEEADEFFEDAVEFVIQKEKASASMLQRQFRIGYNRASRLIEDLEKKGMVGPEDGSKPRKVLITRMMWEEMKSGASPSLEAEQIDIEAQEETGLGGEEK